ncbi:hypothetical protein L5L55_00010 [Shewanella glacialipiscicola]|uniref:hypothetical protein n=1 Tax=Shewanella glacialipiscicola TaxID=614069 RepID=UPI0021D9994F|nr:hypothetical protein [Shewanella glacialipiscicola]MCU7993308.1 hypothetical protein [Shewanella glacialipiscicola]MCU8024625.1 hypothetical protein [Shewanella glacialipiscicola]
MPTIHLEERSDDGAILDTLSGDVSDSDWRILTKFLSHLDRAMECSLIRREIPRITGMKWEAGEMKFNAGSYSNAELYELLHVLRPLILHKEPASFGAVRAILGRCFKNKRLSAHLKELQHIFDHGQLAAYMQVSIGEQPLFDSSLLRIWLNGTQYHTEEEKAAAWSEIEADLTTESALAIIINQLNDRVFSLVLLGQIARTITSESV